jgi:hypothetical protein
MDPRAIFGLSGILGLAAAGLLASCHAWPWLRRLPTERALALLAVPHMFRFMGLSFLVEGVVSPSLPAAFALPAAYGDLVATLLAMAAMIALDRHWSWATLAVWALNVWGAGDLLFATYRGVLAGGLPQTLGAAFYIPTALVPLLLTAHFLSFRLLFSDARHRLPVGRRKRESPAV